MLKLVICDDDSTFAEKLKEKVSDFFSKNSVVFRFNIFSDGSEIIRGNEKFDVVFLDIDMPEITGMETADFLNKRNSQTKIIFVTSHDSYVYESIEYQPFAYLRKSKLKDELNPTLNRLLQYINTDNQLITFNIKTADNALQHERTKTGEIICRINDIIYIEGASHNVNVNTIDAKFEAYGTTLNELEQELSEMGFIRIQKSFIVNYRYIYSINTDDITLDDKTHLPISRKKIAEVQKKFQKWMRG
ncbi:MAG: LytTR family DNA-binding domain-containing protein [Eubacterium sp.]|jgi:DNA-binding LytR/AlgR family response regulator|nr:LytTR family DNA-binding domain-containing protein [Eubacterium sp.]